LAKKVKKQKRQKNPVERAIGIVLKIIIALLLAIVVIGGVLIYMKYGKNYAYTVIMVIAAITVLFGFMIPKIDMDNELRHFFPEKHPSNIRFKQLTADFGDQYAMDIVIETKEDTILRSDYVAAVKNISEELALVDNVVKVRSLTNIEFITAKDGSLVVETLLPEPFSGTAAEIQAIKQKIFEAAQDPNIKIDPHDNTLAVKIYISYRFNHCIPPLHWKDVCSAPHFTEMTLFRIVDAF